MGHTDRERRRLAIQAAVLNPLTTDFLKRAGIEAGMRVLDFGCGVGDVAIVAANLVGPRGAVTAVDLDDGALAVARARAEAEGLTQIQFEHGNLEHHQTAEPYDAVIGRHILIHTSDPLAVIRQAAAHVRRGGIVAFQEYDLSQQVIARPPKPLFQKVFQQVIDLFVRVRMADIGPRLWQIFRDAGLVNVESRGEYVLDGGPECPFYEWIAETVRTLAAKLEATGIATEAELDVDTLADRLRYEAIAIGGSIAGPVMVGTSGRRP